MDSLQRLINELEFFFQTDVALIIIGVFILIIILIIILSVISFIKVWKKSVNRNDYEKLRKIHKEKKFKESCNHRNYRN